MCPSTFPYFECCATDARSLLCLNGANRHVYTPMLAQSPLHLSYKAGPAHALEPDKPRRGDWITEVLVNVTTGTIGTGTGAGADTGAHKL